LVWCVIAIVYVQPIDTAQRRTEGSRIIEVEQHGVATLLAKPLQIRLLAHADAYTGIAWVLVEILQDQAPGLAGDAHEEDEGTGDGRHECSPVIGEMVDGHMNSARVRRTA
jgi:hypothetical protein